MRNRPKLDNEDSPAIDALEELVLKILREQEKLPERYDVSVHTWRDRDGGLRVAEVGYSDGNGGAAWMQGDLDAFPVIFACERYMLDFDREVEDHGGGAILDLEQEARRGLWHALTGTMPDWQERTEAT